MKKNTAKLLSALLVLSMTVTGAVMPAWASAVDESVLESQTEVVELVETESESVSESEVETETVGADETEDVLETEAESEEVTVIETEFVVEKGPSLEGALETKPESSVKTESAAESGVQTNAVDDARAVQTWKDGNITATLDGDVLTLTGSGAMKDYEYDVNSFETNVPWAEASYRANKIVVSEGITSIGSFAFLYANASTITLPGTLKEIHEYAFNECYNLKSIVIPNGVVSIGAGAFSDCGQLEAVTLGDSVQWIDDYAFSRTNIRNLKLPASLEYISLFADASSFKLEGYQVDGNNPYYCAVDGVLMNKARTILLRYPMGNTRTTYTIPGTVNTLEEWSFSESRYLISITVPSSVKTMGDCVFYDCPNLKTATINGSVGTVPYGTFYGDTNLESVTLGEGIKRIEDIAFWGCTALRTVKIPQSITSIEGSAFEECPNLKLDIPSHLVEVDGAYRLVSTLTVKGTYDYTKAFEVLRIVNEERARVGAAPLTMDTKLLEAAMLRASEIHVDFSHTRPSRSELPASGENIAAGNSTASATMNQWMNSPGHRMNILLSDYQSIGIGCFVQDGACFWVQLFEYEPAASVASKSGTVAVSPGIKVSSEDYNDYLEIYRPYPSSPQYGVDNTALNIGDKVQLAVRMNNAGWDYGPANVRLQTSDFNWSSSSGCVAVDTSGKVTAKSKGMAKITATTKDGRMSVSFPISVGQQVINVSGPTGYTGLMQHNGIWYYVEDGTCYGDYTGLCQYNGNWYYVENSKVNWNYTGLCQYNGRWYYCQGGILKWSYTGLCQYNGNWYYVEKGTINWNYTGLVEYNGNWYYCQGSILRWSYTGLCQYKGTWYYVGKGVLRWSYTGLADHEGNRYYIEKGVLRWNYTGLVKYNGIWYYCEGSILKRSYTGLCQYNGAWYYVEKGVLNWDYTGAVKYGSAYYYCKKGILDWNYNGTVTINGKVYNVRGGIVRGI